jgi:hypothetical protein
MRLDWDDDYEDPPNVDPGLTVWLPLEEPWDGLVDARGEPLFTDDPPFGFCSQKET